MRFRSCYIPTLKETPADAEVISQKLLIRAGMIRKLTSGVYTYMPLALRSLRKIEKIIREEQIHIERTFSYDEAGKIALIRQNGTLLEEEYLPEGIRVEAYVPQEIYGKL